MMKMAFPGVAYELNKSDQFIIFDNESEVWFGGLDDKERVEKILGKEYATIYVNESSQISYQTIHTLRTRLAQKCSKSDGRPLPLKMYYDLNPVGKSHWSYQEFVLGVRPENKQKLPEGSRAWVQMNPVDNPNLPEEYLEELQTLPERERKRFLAGEYLSELPGTLWPSENIEAGRIDPDQIPEISRIVVGVDPSGSDGGAKGDAQGIVVVGLGVDGDAYVLQDASCRMSPAGWGARVVDRYGYWEADKIIAEQNYGGAMVKDTILTQDPKANVKVIHATRGKHVRAEPIAALYEEVKNDDGEILERCRVHHVGRFPELEDQMGAFTTEGYQGSDSPDRADALVWALTELMLKKKSKFVWSLDGEEYPNEESLSA